MFSFYIQGLMIGAAMILPLGPQNAFVMNQGIRRQYHLMIALLCAMSDMLLICAGIFGGSALLMQSPGCWRWSPGAASRFCCGTALVP